MQRRHRVSARPFLGLPSSERQAEAGLTPLCRPSPVRALAIPPPGKSFITRKPLPPGYDPHDSKTWIPPFGPVSAEQERLYFEPALQPSELEVGPSGTATTSFKADEPVAPVFTQSGRTVKRRVPNPIISTTESDGDPEGGPRKARGRKPAKRGRRRSSPSTSPNDVPQASHAIASDVHGAEAMPNAAPADVAVGMDIDQAEDAKPEAHPGGPKSSQDAPTPSQDAAAILLQLMIGMEQAAPVRAPAPTVQTSTSNPGPQPAPHAGLAAAEQSDMRPPSTNGMNPDEEDTSSSRRSRRTSSRPSHMQDYAIFPGARKGRQKQ